MYISSTWFTITTTLSSVFISPGCIIWRSISLRKTFGTQFCAFALYAPYPGWIFFFGLTLALALLESLPWAFPFSSHYHLFKGRSRYHLILWTCITLNGMWCIYWAYIWDNIETRHLNITVIVSYIADLTWEARPNTTRSYRKDWHDWISFRWT
jgi:hypothetical protein